MTEVATRLWFGVLTRMRRDHRLATLWLFIGCALVYFVTAEYQYVIGINDAIFTLIPAWSFSQFGDVDLNNFRTSKPLVPWAFPVGDELRTDRFPGGIVIAVPFYWLFGSSTFSMEPGISSAVLASAVAVAFLHRALLRIVPATVALGAALLTAFGTSVWTVAADTAWTHAPTLLGLSIGFWGMARGSRYLAGFGYAFAIFSRPHTAVVAAAQGLWAGWRERSIGPVFDVAVSSAMGFVLLLMWNRYNSERWTIMPGTYSTRVDFVTNANPAGPVDPSLWFSDLLYVLGSPLRGVLVLSPFIVVMMLGLIPAWRAAPAWVRAGAVASPIYLYVQLSGNTWNGGAGFFGYRITLEAVYLLVPLGALSWTHFVRRYRWTRILLLVTAVASLWWYSLAAAAMTAFRPQTFDWRTWDVARLVGWTNPLGWFTAAAFVAALLLILRTYSRRVDGGAPGAEPAIVARGGATDSASDAFDSASDASADEPGADAEPSLAGRDGD